MFSATLALAGLVVFWLMVGAFAIAVARRNSGITDIVWGIAVVAAVLAIFLWQNPYGLRPMLVLILVAVWGMRLATHIILRNWGSPEEWRHAHLRVKWGEWYLLRSFLTTFVLRGFLLVLVSAPALWVVTFGGPQLSWLDYAGLAVWLVGYGLETVADYQLVRFLKTPSHHGRTLFTGLWQYSRHPNYFGELTMWWGLWLIALSVPGGWMTIIGPFALSAWILLRSIPLLESKMLKNAEYQRYSQHTDELIPWF